MKNKYFIRLAIKKLQSQNIKIIAITGSNGKTSIKNILHTILSEQYKTETTPHSYNTPLGISKYINNELKKDTEFLILEFGARKKKDISTLCKLFAPGYGIVSLVASQHLETFKSVENIYKTKKELPDALGKKLCIYNIDNIYTLRMLQEKYGEKLAVSIFSSTDIYAKNITIKNGITSFNLCLNSYNISRYLSDKKEQSITSNIDNPINPADKNNNINFNFTSTNKILANAKKSQLNNTNEKQIKIIKLSTALLGRHNVLNITLACCMASYLGVTMNNIQSSVEKLRPSPHRLELIKGHINILDDSYNCSIASAKESLLVLSKFPGIKMVATPGIIETGKQSYDINYKLGQMLIISDQVIIVGETNKKAILNGLLSKNYHQKNIIFAKSLEQAKPHFAKLKANDTLLLLNDLPDDYK